MDVKQSSNIRSFSFQLGTRLETRNLSQGDSQGVSFTARSYDLARPGVARPLVGDLSAISFHLYSAADMSIATLITQ